MSARTLLLHLPRQAREHIAMGHVLEPNPETGKYLSKAGYVTCSCGLSFDNGFLYQIELETGEQSMVDTSETDYD